MNISPTKYNNYKGTQLSAFSFCLNNFCPFSWRIFLSHTAPYPFSLACGFFNFLPHRKQNSYSFIFFQTFSSLSFSSPNFHCDHKYSLHILKFHTSLYLFVAFAFLTTPSIFCIFHKYCGIRHFFPHICNTDYPFLKLPLLKYTASPSVLQFVRFLFPTHISGLIVAYLPIPCLYIYADAPWHF